MVSKFNVRFYFISFDFYILNKICFNILELSKSFNLKISGPVYLPTKRKFYNILRSPHVNKDSRDQLEICIFKRFVDFFLINNFSFFLVKDIYSTFNIDFIFKLI